LRIRRVTRLKNLGVILNKASADGYHLTSASVQAESIKIIASFSEKSSINLLIRDKPFGSNTRYFSDLCALDVDKIREATSIEMDCFIDRCDLIVIFDSPTSASIEVLRRGVPVVHLCLRELVSEESAILPEVITTFSLASLLDFCRQCVTEEDFLQNYAEAQSSSYLELGLSSRSFRSELRSRLVY
jgi:hypothetical protein